MEADRAAIRHNIRVMHSDPPWPEKELGLLGLSRRRVERIRRPFRQACVALERVHFSIATALKEEMEAAGGAGAVEDALAARRVDEGSMVLLGTEEQFRAAASACKDISEKVHATVSGVLLTLQRYRRRTFRLTYPRGALEVKDRPLIMGVLNVTPDSFYDGGRYDGVRGAVAHGVKIWKAGADVIDVGGESTRPGAKALAADEEKRRVLEVIRRLSAEVPVPISIDTYKAEVADAAVRAGAKMINDIYGLRREPALAEVAAHHGVPVVLMHIKGEPGTMQENPRYDNIMSEICSHLRRSVEMARGLGIPEDRLLVDPGIGFGKRWEDNLLVLNRLEQLRSLGLPLVVGVSRKSFIGAALGGAPPEARLSGTIGACVVAARNGASVLRVHDPQEVREAMTVAAAVWSERFDVAG